MDSENYEERSNGPSFRRHLKQQARILPAQDKNRTEIKRRKSSNKGHGRKKKLHVMKEEGQRKRVLSTDETSSGRVVLHHKSFLYSSPLMVEGESVVLVLVEETEYMTRHCVEGGDSTVGRYRYFTDRTLHSRK